MIYLNKYRHITEEAEKSLYSLVKDLINKNTTNILEVGTMAGQVTVILAGAAAEKKKAAEQSGRAPHAGTGALRARPRERGRRLVAPLQGRCLGQVQ